MSIPKPCTHELYTKCRPSLSSSDENQFIMSLKKDKFNTIMDEQIIAPRTFGGLYFSFLSIITTIFIQLTIYASGFKQYAPFLLTLLWGALISYLFGTLFGKPIIQSKPPYKLKSFLLGVLLFLCALPFYAFGLMLIVKHYHSDVFIVANNLYAYFAFYIYILIFNFFLMGSWLCILCGFAAFFLRSKLTPDFKAFLKRRNQKDVQSQ